MRLQNWILVAGLSVAALNPALAQMSGSYPMSSSMSPPMSPPMSSPMSNGYPTSPPMSGSYPGAYPGSPPMSGYDPGYGGAPGYGEGQRKRAAFLGPLLMQLMPMIVNPMVQSFVDSRRQQGPGRPEAPSFTESFAKAPSGGFPPGVSAPMQLPSQSMPQPSPSMPMSQPPMPSQSMAMAPTAMLSSPTAVARSVSAPDTPTAPIAPAGFEAGIAYEVFHVQPDGTEHRVSPAERVNRQGDRFYVRFMTNLPGQVLAYNVDPGGQRTTVGEWSVEGGFPQRLPARGHFRFEGEEAGRELLEFQFTPCRNAVAMRSRAIRVVEEAESSLRACTEALATPAAGRRMRAIVAVEDDKTAFATAPAATLGQDMPGLSVTLEFRKE
jgi:hypothetical protein